MKYVILNQLSDLFWSNEMGWVDIQDAEIFTKEEREKLRLPLDGIWAEIKS